MKKAWADPDSKFNSPEYRAGQARDKKAWWDAHPEKKEELAERMRGRRSPESIARRDEKARKKALNPTKHSEGAKKRWADPEYREKMRLAQKRRWELRETTLMKHQKALEISRDLTHASDRNLAHYYRKEIKAGDLTNIPKGARSRLKKAGIVGYPRYRGIKGAGLSLTPYGERLLEEAEGYL